MDGTNASTNFLDSGPSALTVTAVGNAQISTTQSKYGGASAYFDGTGDYLSLTGNSSFQFGTGDFTVETWVYISANAANQQTFVDTRGTATATPFTCGIYQSKLAFYDGTMRQSSATVTTGQWYHFAACRSGGTLRLFIDGISYYSASSSTNFTTGANSIYIGRGFDAAAYYTNGYIDDLRITKYARYTSAFTPPTQAFPNLYNPNTTLPVSGAALWLDASQQSSLYSDAGFTPVTTSGQSIYQWNDLSGNNRHAVQATSGNRPTWVPPASGQNGLGAVSFNGTSQRISTATSGLSAQPFEHYVVFKFNSTGTADRIVFGTVDRGNFDGNGLGGWNLYSGSLLAGGTRTGTSWAMANCKFNGSSSILRINASQVLSGNTGTGYPTAFSIAGNGSTDWGDITVAEFICYPSSLSTGDQNLVESYLKTKWGTP